MTSQNQPNNARMVDYVLGGSHHFAIDRQAADMVQKLFPEGAELVRAQRRFLQRAVAWMAEERGISRFLDFGSGLPSAGNVHDVALETSPNAHVVYTDRDPITVTYSHELLQPFPHVNYVQYDITNLGEVLADPLVAKLRAGGAPVGLVMVGIAMYIPPEKLTTMLDELYHWAPAGSTLALVLMSPRADVHPGMDIYRRQGFTFYTQTEPQVRALLGKWQPTAEGIIGNLGWRYQPDATIATSDLNWSLVATR